MAKGAASLIEEAESILAFRSEHLPAIPVLGVRELADYLERLRQFAADASAALISERLEVEFYEILRQYPILLDMHFASIAAKSMIQWADRRASFGARATERMLTAKEAHDLANVEAALAVAEHAFRDALSRCIRASEQGSQ